MHLAGDTFNERVKTIKLFTVSQAHHGFDMNAAIPALRSRSLHDLVKEIDILGGGL
jgi:hypothetical protein